MKHPFGTDLGPDGALHRSCYSSINLSYLTGTFIPEWCWVEPLLESISDINRAKGKESTLDRSLQDTRHSISQVFR